MKYKLLAILFGFVLKLHDDLNDNDLYNLLKIPNSEYVNEFLKAMIYMIFVTISLKYKTFWASVCCIFSMGSFYDRNAYNQPFEKCALICAICFGVLLPSITISLPLILAILVMNIIYYYEILFFAAKEFSKMKFWFRFGLIIFVSLTIKFSHFLGLPKGVELCLYFLASYAFTSAIFQALLNNKDTITKWCGNGKIINPNSDDSNEPHVIGENADPDDKSHVIEENADPGDKSHVIGVNADPDDTFLDDTSLSDLNETKQ